MCKRTTTRAGLRQQAALETEKNTEAHAKYAAAVQRRIRLLTRLTKDNSLRLPIPRCSLDH